MEPQVNETTLVLKVTQNIGDFPANVDQIEQAIKQAKKSDPLLASVPEDNIRRMVISANTKMIQWQFLDMMQTVLKKIEPEIKHYPQHKSIKYLESIIYEHLDMKIFSTVRISKIRTKLLGNTLEAENLTMTDKLFTELISVMNELLQIMKEYYGLPRDDRISGILFQCISMFIAENQNCFLVQQDKLESQSQIKEGKKNLRHGQETSAEKTKRRSQAALHTAEHLIGTLYAQIQQVNPFSAKKMDQKQIEEKKKILKNMESVKKRQALNNTMVKVVQKLLGMRSKEIIMTMGKEEKAQFAAVLYDSLEDASKLSSSNSKLSKIKHIQSEMVSMLESTIDCEESQLDEQLQNYKEFKWIALLYKALQKEYHTDTERRKWLLKFCQSQYISKRIQNPYSVIKILESEKLEESDIVKALRNLPLAVMAQESKKVELGGKKEVESHLAIEHQINRIHLYELKKKYAKEPVLEFQRLTNSRGRVITFLFSGFLSEDTCKVKEWSGLLNNFYDSQVYSVRWESKTVKNMFEFAIKSVTDLGPTQSIAMLGGPYVKAIAIMHNLYQKFQENPFNPAFESAISTGEFLAEFIMHNFKGYFINLVGFSLGTELIRNIMVKMAEKNCLHMLNKVYLLGGVADKTQVQNLIQASPSPLTVINLYSDNDYILKYLLRLCKGGIQPVGLNAIKQIEGHTIKNEDCTFYVEGHLAYRSNLQFFCKLLKMADD